MGVGAARQGRELAMLDGALAALGDATTCDAAARDLLVALARTTQSECGWYFAGTDGAGLELRAASSPEGPLVPALISDASGLVGSALAAGGVACSSEQAEDPLGAACERAGLSNQLVVVVRAERGQMAAIVLASRNELAPSPNERQVLLQVMRLFLRTAERLSRLDVMADRLRNEEAANAVLRRIAVASSAQEAVLDTMEALCGVFGFVYAASFVPKEPGVSGSPLLPLGDFGKAPAAFRTATMCSIFADGEGYVGRAKGSADLVAMHELSASLLGVRAELARSAGLTGGVCLPLWANGQVLAVLELWCDTDEATSARLGNGLLQSAAVSTLALERLTERDALVESMRTFAAEIVRVSEVLRTSTVEQSMSAKELDFAVEDVRGLLELLGTASKEALRSAETVIQQAGRAESSSERGRASVSRTIESVVHIRDQVREITERIHALKEQSSKVRAIIATVNEIGDQSKLLSFNAAIEAARAGEHGRGFGVVANEVRVLAEQSRAATSQARAILGQIEAGTEAAVRAAVQGAEKTAVGLLMADESGDRIGELADSMSASSRSAIQIADSARQQSRELTRVTRALASISSATVASNQQAHEVESAAEQLAGLAQRMALLVNTLRSEQTRTLLPPAPDESNRAERWG